MAADLPQVLSVASEIFPLVKTGGLGDVAAALPPALTSAGAPVLTMVPGYPAVTQALMAAEPVHGFADLFGGPATVLLGSAAGLRLLVLDAPHLYRRDGNPYLGPDGREWPDNGIRFAALGAAAGALAVGMAPGLTFDIVHAHDWQAALAAVYLRVHPGARPGTVLTIHNMAFQGRYPGSLFPRLGLPPALFGIDGLEYYGDVDFLKGGIACADRITTVSPTYAREITGIDNGMGLDGVLRHRSAHLSGILNGIDTTVWDPAADPLIAARFGPDTLACRPANAKALRQRMGMEDDSSRLLIGVVSRLTTQKGLDMLLACLPVLRRHGMQLALLGSGEAWMEQGFRSAAALHPGHIGCVFGYDESLAHLIQAGSDAILVPSRFEPCGLTQLYALRYGAVPVVARVGGLADTIIDANPAALAAGVATGLQFWPATADALENTLDRLNTLWHDQAMWRRMQVNGMAADVSWDKSAACYVSLYRELMAEAT